MGSVGDVQYCNDSVTCQSGEGRPLTGGGGGSGDDDEPDDEPDDEVVSGLLLAASYVHVRPVREHRLHAGFASSHLMRRLLYTSKVEISRQFPELLFMTFSLRCSSSLETRGGGLLWANEPTSDASRLDPRRPALLTRLRGVRPVRARQGVERLAEEVRVLTQLTDDRLQVRLARRADVQAPSVEKGHDRVG